MNVTDGAYGADALTWRRPVQLPVELGPRLHRQLTQWCRDTARFLDVPAIPRADVIEALLALLITDPAVSGAVQDHLRDRADDRTPGPRSTLETSS